MSFLNNLDWRNAEKNFDPTKKVSDNDLAKILHAIRMAPSSWGVQPYHIFVIGDQTTKLKLKGKGYNQQQYQDSSHVLVFCGRNDLASRVDKYFEIASNGDPIQRKSMEAYEKMMRGSMESKNPEEGMNWAYRQTYLALGFGLAACAELKIDACPMEGFDPSGFAEILKLPSDIKAVATMSIGYRKELPHSAKIRFPEDDLFTKIKNT
ncbi:NAD(P)H-dependent oxidoreductase [Candidatus Peregrinibacteria bacterium]|nr:NAD(P)H-dependent oxidoreductase [Candidatus Peregrinibacteria bacterium]